MKFSPDCARNIMLAVEALEPDKTLTIPKLAEMYPDYSEDVINYNCLKLFEARFVVGVTVDVPLKTLPQVSRLYSLTFEGHQALEDMRPTSVWKQAKKAAEDLGSLSLHALAEIAANIVSASISSRFNQ
jgi:hypothetical protein|uniref:Multiple antibiotic resistance protein MarR/DNA family protein, HTH motif.67A n=1 Tax=Siphoviridae sp. ctmP938 TaxID=2827933 RepID=A0A8S5S461_9CAUD|nr:MAG TPA: multiple antibiotic resistance protein MarR/DNA family protein, HTH motif.67A [Siphoviridae sp. ctmP938]